MTLVDFERLNRDLPSIESRWRKMGKEETPIVVLDDLLVSSHRREIYDSFPDSLWGGWNDIGDTFQPTKASSESIALYPGNLAALVHELNSGPMIRLIERLTGLTGLLPDPHLWGGGLHVMKPGGYLWPHTDFLQGYDPRMTRVINLIIYVHPHWQEEMGGHFQLWSGQQITHSTSPSPGRCVIFQTDELSVHGVSRVVGELERRSVAVFYYTLSGSRQSLSDRTTGWRFEQRPQGAEIGALRRGLASTLMAASVALRRASIALNQRAEQLLVNAGRPGLSKSED